MPILTQRTQLEVDLLQKEELVIRAAEAAHNLATVLQNCNNEFWSLPTNRLLAVLNADVSATLETFAQNTALGVACNVTLDAVGLEKFANRAPVEPKRKDIVFDGSNFVCTAQEQPTEPQPE
jgi:hypothetical protein